MTAALVRTKKAPEPPEEIRVVIQGSRRGQNCRAIVYRLVDYTTRPMSYRRAERWARTLAALISWGRGEKL